MTNNSIHSINMALFMDALVLTHYW